MNTLNTVLFFLSSAMLLPVIVLLLLLFVRSLLLIGGFFAIAAVRIKIRAAAGSVLSRTQGNPPDPESIRKAFFGTSMFVTYVHKLLACGKSSTGLEHLITEFELKAAAYCEKSKLIMRVGPMLGLMGTLIPMGPALAGLASGELGMMAQNMQIAFATTVIGVFCGAIGFVLNTIHRRWYAEELADLVFIEEVLAHEE
jgi:biopolymer transport protein ExbB/TolQ